jgi:hypothetical protein
MIVLEKLTSNAARLDGGAHEALPFPTEPTA